MILVTGGAGYIGSHVVKGLLDHHYQVVVLDDLSTGHKEAVDRRAQLIIGDVKKTNNVNKVLDRYPVKAVMHFAANCYVGESVINPKKYYENNVSSMISLLDAMVSNNVKKIIFSSSCAVYGIPAHPVIDESTAKNPISPYGRTKLIAEEMIKDYSIAYGLEYINLRYFNVAGADPNGCLGEDHHPETHILPNILMHLAGEIPHINVYGNDYDTADGTCIRDYIHVSDLAEGHIHALAHLLEEKRNNTSYNLGNGIGYSVKQLIDSCERITGGKAKVVYDLRRKGDPPRLVANSDKITQELGWKAKYTLEDMVRTAWGWLQKNPDGYGDGKRKGE